MRTKILPEELAAQQETIARHCENLRNLLEAESNGLFEVDPPERPVVFLEELTRRGAIAKKRATTYRSAGKVDRPHFLRQCALLWLWETNGGDLGISTPRQSRDEATRPDPHGPVIDYFQAAAKVVFGDAPTPGRIKEIVRDYRHLNFSASRISSKSDVAVDDSKVSLLRDGKLLDKDGNVVREALKR